MAQAPMVIETQPGFVRAPQKSNCQTSLCDCLSDCRVCLCGTLGFPHLGCQVVTDMNGCCLCGTTETLYQTRYGIPGSNCDDCMSCSLCVPDQERQQQQESREQALPNKLGGEISR